MVATYQSVRPKSVVSVIMGPGRPAMEARIGVVRGMVNAMLDCPSKPLQTEWDGMNWAALGDAAGAWMGSLGQNRAT